jgi:hypothetical protein
MVGLTTVSCLGSTQSRSIAQAQLARKKVQEYVRNRLSELRDECVEMRVVVVVTVVINQAPWL